MENKINSTKDFNGTALDNFILPVVNPGDLLKK